MQNTAPLKSFKKRGFTLIEVLIVVILVGILAVAGINGISGMQRVAKLNEAYSRISGMIEQARSFAVNGKQVPDFTDENHNNIFAEENTTANAYGVYLQKDTYGGDDIVVILFADYNNKSKGKYDATNTGLDNATPPEKTNSSDYVIDYYNIPTGYDLKLNGFDSTTFMYYPPLGKFNLSLDGFTPPEPPNDYALISLCYRSCDNSSNARKEIKIYRNSSGLPEKPL